TLNCMRHFGMLEGEMKRPKEQRFLDMEWQGVSAPVAGVFTALADHNDILDEGQLIGRITDLDGSTLAEVHSPVDGIVHTLYVRRVVYPGDMLFTLLKIDEPTGW
ncbi:hypothetical protein HQ586_01970, partial [Candidatus Bathyarchaeota archaeon]|nr:hypothetical protein [Candidatus Bathyarchaeota archaeon]